jgi:hypothetical protein
MRRGSRLTRTTLVAAAAAIALGGAAALAQFGGRRFGGDGAPPAINNTPYDGRFTFARIRFTPPGGAVGWFEGGPDVKWHHDYPRAERHFAKILEELTTIRPYMDGGNVIALDDPELFKYPMAYLCEAGFWVPTDAEAAGLRAYLQKGGFIMFDDFFNGRAWENFAEAMRKVLPEAQLVRLDATHPIFDAFFRVEELEEHSISGRRQPPEFWGIYEDNDPAKRLLAIINYNNDIGESWEWSDTGTLPVDITSTAYKLGVNYLVYSMTH